MIIPIANAMFDGEIIINDLIKEKISLFKCDRTYYCKFYSVTKHKTPSRLKFGLNILNNKKNSLPTNICFNGIIPNKTFLKKKGATLSNQ